MSDVEMIPELKQILGAMLFAAKEPVTMTQMLQVFQQTAEQYGGITKDFAEVSEENLKEAIELLNKSLKSGAIGLQVREVANGYRMVNDLACGSWLRVLLEKGKATKLSRPALETLAIIAYRQPVVRSEIEAVRGVAVDQMIRNLLELQLIRVIGRSELPGRPWLFGTTQKFLEHFGIKSLEDLPATGELRRMDNEQFKRAMRPEQKELNMDAEEAPVEEEPEDGMAAESVDAPYDSEIARTEDEPVSERDATDTAESPVDSKTADAGDALDDEDFVDADELDEGELDEDDFDDEDELDDEDEDEDDDED